MLFAPFGDKSRLKIKVSKFDSKPPSFVVSLLRCVHFTRQWESVKVKVIIKCLQRRTVALKEEPIAFLVYVWGGWVIYKTNVICGKTLIHKPWTGHKAILSFPIQRKRWRRVLNTLVIQPFKADHISALDDPPCPHPIKICRKQTLKSHQHCLPYQW